MRILQERRRQQRIAEITEMIHVASLLHDDVIDNAGRWPPWRLLPTTRCPVQPANPNLVRMSGVLVRHVAACAQTCGGGCAR